MLVHAIGNIETCLKGNVRTTNGFTAAAIKVCTDGQAHKYLHSIAKISHADCTTISQWQLGLVAFHQTCKGCGVKNALSWKHTLECSGVIFELEMLASEIAEAGQYGPTAMDVLINDGVTKGFSAE